MFRMQTPNCLSLRITTCANLRWRVVTLRHFVGLRSHRVDRREFWNTWISSHSHSRCHVYTLPIHIPISAYLCFHSHGIPTGMESHFHAHLYLLPDIETWAKSLLRRKQQSHFTVSGSLSVCGHVDNVITSCAQSIQAMRILRAHGMAAASQHNSRDLQCRRCCEAHPCRVIVVGLYNGRRSKTTTSCHSPRHPFWPLWTST